MEEEIALVNGSQEQFRQIFRTLRIQMHWDRSNLTLIISEFTLDQRSSSRLSSEGKLLVYYLELSTQSGRHCLPSFWSYYIVVSHNCSLVASEAGMSASPPTVSAARNLCTVAYAVNRIHHN